MYLSDRDILLSYEWGEITISDFDISRLQPASYDIRLDNYFLIPDKHRTPVVDPVMKVFPTYQEVTLNDDEVFILHPNDVILARSYETFGSSNLLIQLSGKSSLARIGLIIHNTAGIVNPGHTLQMVFELCNLSQIPIVLRPKMSIAQLLFSPLTSEPISPYGSKGQAYHTNNWQVSYRGEEIL